MESVAAQTHKSFEVIIADDGSTDGTDAVVAEFKDKFKLQYLWEPNWGGPARPRNRAAAAASGEWLAFLDSDDLWHPNKLETVAKFLDGNDVVYHALEEMDATGSNARIIKAPQIDQDNPFIDLILNGNRLANSATCVRTSAFNGVGGVREDRSIVAVEDYDLWLRLAKAKFKFKAIEQPLGKYIIGFDNISALSPKFIRALNAVIKYNSEDLSFSRRRKAQQFINYLIGSRNLNSGNYLMASKYFTVCLFDVPSAYSAKSTVRLLQSIMIGSSDFLTKK